MSSNSLAPQYIKYEIRRGVEPSHMEKYTFIDRYFHSQRELLDIRHSEERDINTLFTYPFGGNPPLYSCGLSAL